MCVRLSGSPQSAAWPECAVSILANRGRFMGGPSPAGYEDLQFDSLASDCITQSVRASLASTSASAILSVSTVCFAPENEIRRCPSCSMMCG